MAQQNISEMLATTLSKVREAVSADTVIGTPVTLAEDVTVVPVSQVSIGLAGGGSDFGKAPAPVKFAGGTGAGIFVKPLCFLCYDHGEIRMLSCDVTDGPLAGLVESIPGAVERIVDFVNALKERK